MIAVHTGAFGNRECPKYGFRQIIRCISLNKYRLA